MKRFEMVMVLVVAGLLAGCATNIAKLPITARDMESYENKFAEEYYAKEEAGALKIAVVPQDPGIPGEDNRTLMTLKSLTTAFGDGLDTSFSNLSDFDVVPRTELGAILADKELIGMTSDETPDFEVANVDFMVVYRVSSYNFEQFVPLFQGEEKKPAFRAYVKVKISLINLNDNVKEFTKTITGQSEKSAPSQTIGLLNQAIENAVRDFSTQFAVEYAPPAIVQQTKGEGKVALLNIGKDYGVMKNMKMEFFFFKEKGKKRFAIPFAYGKIIEIGEETSWIEVEKFKDAGVKENHFARVRKNQSKSFLEQLAP